jgi:hypothetical protein
MKRFVVELYRALPKKTREILAIDELLKNPAIARPGAKQAKVFEYRADINDLEAELEEFLSDAYAQNYFAPNTALSTAKIFGNANLKERFRRISSRAIALWTHTTI